VTQSDVAARTLPGKPGVRSVGIIMQGVTGRMGTNQHLVRSILAIRAQGGLRIGDETIWPEPLLVGRNERKLAALASAHGIDRWTTNLDEALAEPGFPIFFDAQSTLLREQALRAAIAAGKHVYCEKPTTADLASSLELARLARAAGVKNGIVQDKLFLPGLRKLRRVIDSGFLGTILSIRGEFGYWVFEGPAPPSQRPSWNYRRELGGGIVIDMFCHWRYVLDNLFGPVRSVFALGATHVPVRFDEDSQPYECTAEDAAYAVFEIEGGAVAQINASWCTRVDRDELLELQVDGSGGSAVAGLRECKTQHRSTTPAPIWNPDMPNPIAFRDGWSDVPDSEQHENGFKLQWEQFLRHVVADEPFPWDFLEGAKGIQLAELAMQSWRERRMLDVPELQL
jgi:predicted dehydrogenase